MSKKLSFLMFILLLASIVACGGNDTADLPVDEVADEDIVAVEATPTLKPDPTDTSVPPTATAEPIEASILTNLDSLEGASPHLVGIFPEAGGELGLNDPIELYFDQPMDREKTADALTLISNEGDQIGGSVEWLQPRVLRFQPDMQLAPSTQYELVLAETAVSEAGSALLDGLSLPVQTIGNIEITQVSPAAGSINVLADSAITVIFNRPIVPLVINQEQDELPNPLEIIPAAEGVGEWVNTSVYVWRPTEPLRGRETYTVRVSADVVNEANVNGATLPSDSEWRFTVTPPTINRLSLPGVSDYARDNYQHMRLDQGFRLIFNQPMDPAVTQTAISLASSTGQMPLEFDWNDVQTSVTFTPTQLMDLGSEYVLTVSDNAQSIYGGRLREGLLWRGTTSLPPAIVRTVPADGATNAEFSSRFKIDFASRMSVESLQGKVIFDPPISGDPNGLYNSWEWSLAFWGLAPSTTYTVRLLPGVADIYGNTIDEERVLTFTTAAYTSSAALQMHNPFAIYRQGGSTAVWTSYRNVNQLNLNISELSATGFINQLNDYGATHGQDNFVLQETADVSSELNTRGYQRFDLRDGNGNQIPNGFYFVTIDSPQITLQNGQRHAETRPIIIANANLTVKTTTSEVMMWLTDLDSARPLPNIPVVLYRDNGSEVVRGVTDANGVFYADELSIQQGWDSRYYAVTEDENILGMALADWDEGVNPYDFGINTDFWLEPGETNTYIYTDRPIYRPNQSVFFKGIVRVNDDLRYELPSNTAVNVKIGSYEGEVYNESLPLSELGTFEGELILDSEAVLGNYFIEVTANDTWLGSGSFNVAEFRKPTFQVDVQAPVENFLAGETVRAVVDGEFFSGGAVANGEVTWNLVDNDHTFRLDGALARYSFSNDDRDFGYYYYYGGSNYGNTIANGSGTTNRQGEFVIEVPAEYATEGGTRAFTLEATVTDIAGNAVSGRTTVYVHPSQLYAGIKPSSRVARATDEMRLDVAVVDWSGTLQPNQTFAVEIVKRNWYSVQEEDENGNVIWNTSVEEEAVAEFSELTADGNGRASVPFTPTEGGTYRAYAIVRDGRGNENRTSTYFWVSGSEFVPWRRVSDHSFELISDADSYKPGETAEILIASPFQGEATALVTVERGHIYEYEVLQLTENSTIYRLPVTGEMAPNIFVSVMIMKGVDNVYSTAPDFKVGMLQFDVERDKQLLNIDIQPNQEVFGPKDTVTYDVRVTDSDGNPVQAELSLSLVDLAVLSLADPNSPNILDFFYSKRWLGVRTALMLTKEMDSYNRELQEEIKGGGGGGGGFGVLTIREDFKDTAYWSAQITTDGNGMAQASVELPDNLTTWRLDVRAVTADTKVGQTTNDIRTTIPLQVAPQTPRFFIVGDQAQVGLVVRNTTDNALVTQVNIDAEGVDLLDEATKEVIVPSGDQALVLWNVVVQDVNRVDFVFSAKSGEYEDATRPTLGMLENQGIPVYKYEVPETVGTSGQLLDGGVALESIGIPIFPNSPNYVPTEGEVRVAVAPSLAAAMTDGLDYLEHYRYECTEQVVSKFLPNVLTTKALQEAGLADPEMEAHLKEQVNVALQKLYSRQRTNGGWPWWTGSRTSTLVSAYVVLSLVEARDAGYTVREEAIQDGVRYLLQNTASADGMRGRFRANRQAFIVYVLARAGEQPTNEITNLFDDRQTLDLYARAMLGEAMALVNPNDARIQTLVDDMIGTALISATGTHWEEDQGRHDYWNWNTDTRTTAVVMGFLAKQQPESPLVANSVRWLMANRTNGRWRSTQETAFTLMSLTDWMVESGELEADYAFEVALNGEILGAGEANASTLRTPVELNADITTLFTDELNRLAIGRTDGGGNLYYTAHMNIYLPVPELKPLDSGFIISRQYYNPDDLTTPIDSAQVGDTVLGKLTIVIPNTRHYVIIDDWLPAGLEAIDTSLKTSTQQGDANQYEGGERVDQGGDFYSGGWGWWYFDHVQLRDERVEISARVLPAGTYEYTYLARASTPGTFNVIPPTAQEFYFPELYGRGSGFEFTVVPIE